MVALPRSVTSHRSLCSDEMKGEEMQQLKASWDSLKLLYKVLIWGLLPSATDWGNQKDLGLLSRQWHRVSLWNNFVARLKRIPVCGGGIPVWRNLQFFLGVVMGKAEKWQYPPAVTYLGKAFKNMRASIFKKWCCCTGILGWKGMNVSCSGFLKKYLLLVMKDLRS